MMQGSFLKKVVLLYTQNIFFLAATVDDCDNLHLIIGAVLAGILGLCILFGTVTCIVMKWVSSCLGAIEFWHFRFFRFVSHNRGKDLKNTKLHFLCHWKNYGNVKKAVRKDGREVEDKKGWNQCIVATCELSLFSRNVFMLWMILLNPILFTDSRRKVRSGLVGWTRRDTARCRWWIRWTRTLSTCWWVSLFHRTNWDIKLSKAMLWTQSSPFASCPTCQPKWGTTQHRERPYPQLSFFFITSEFRGVGFHPDPYSTDPCLSHTNLAEATNFSKDKENGFSFFQTENPTGGPVPTQYTGPPAYDSADTELQGGASANASQPPAYEMSSMPPSYDAVSPNSLTSTTLPGSVEETSFSELSTGSQRVSRGQSLDSPSSQLLASASGSHPT